MMSDRLVRASDVVGLPVVTIDGGDDIAEIRDVVFDGRSHRLLGFTLNKRGWFRGRLRERLGSAAVESIGPDAVMVATAEDLIEPERRRDDGGVADSYDVLGTRVVSSAGTELGEVSGVIVSTGADPAAVGYELTDGGGKAVFVPISAELALSDDNLIVPAAADDFVRNDLAGFGAAVREYRSKLDRAGVPTTREHSS